MKKVDVKEHAREREQRILQYWKDEQTFQKSIEQKEGKPSFVFYEGPPTANGLPHAGHVLGRVFKDFVARYQSMNGYKVRRKAGWDTHGLPVELGVEKQLGISGKKDIEEYGVEAFIQKCKESVFNYERQWREFTESIGYWLDMDDPYVTLDNDYIESVWHILGTIHERDLLYKGHRVTPYCPSCQTSLSSHEVAQGYKDVKDLSATAKFKNKETGEFFIVWTTTPWTLPSNVALAVHEEIDYVKVKQNDEVYILAKNLVGDVFKDQGEYEVLSTHKGAEFVGVAYQPPFSFFNLEKGHVVISADFVSDKSGTGIVHLAPAYGEDDYHAVQKHGLDFINPIDSAGRYKEEVSLFAGRFVKDCDVDIVRYLAENNLLFSKEKYEHSYPFCWRCDSPLLYYAMESWFIKTTAVKDKLIENNQKITWYPEHIKNGRFGKFLEDLIDWNISRSRYWGTPLNVWVCQECDHQFAPKSRAELKEHAQQEIDINIELHKPYVDDVTCSCTKCGGTMKRTPEVIDVWFDSGSMPFAQYHYPFENENLFEEQYPADIICEGIDQTRGWFYSLLAVSTLFKGEPAYKRVMSLGHILDENGQKMSKSKGNVINPTELVEEFGADALRWALISDSAPWNSKRFSKRIVGEAKSKVVDTLNNVHSFFTLYASIDGFKYEEHVHRPELAVNQRPLLDRWIISRLQSTTKVVKTGLDQYDFTRPSQTLERFIDDLSNWYVRRSRERFWGEGISEDKAAAYLTLHEVLTTVTRIMAPFIPFITEDIHSNLTGGSVHLSEFPTVNEAWLDTKLEQEMDQVLEVVELARQVRNSTAIKTKQPLSELIVIAQGENLLQSGAYNEIIQDEINVKMIDFNASEEELVSYSLKLNFKVAGRKFGKINNELNQKLQALSAAEAKALLATGKLELESSEGPVTLEEEDVLVEKNSKEGYASTSGSTFTVALNTELTEELIQEGLVREVARAIQDHRKKLNLPVEKRINLALALPADLKQAVENFNDLLHESVLIHSLEVIEFEQRTADYTVVQAGKDELGIAVRD